MQLPFDKEPLYKEPEEKHRITPLPNAPLTKKGWFGKQKEIKIQENYIENIRKELKKNKINTQKIEENLKHIDKGKYTDTRNIEPPLILLIRENGTTEWYEKGKAGNLKITRSDGRIAIIRLPKRKLLTMKWGDQNVPIWIVDEIEAVALPGEQRMDSAMVYQAIEEVISNRKNFEAEKLDKLGNLALMVALGIVVIIVAVLIAPQMLTGKSIFELTNTNKTTTNTTITDINQMTPEQLNEMLIRNQINNQLIEKQLKKAS